MSRISSLDETTQYRACNLCEALCGLAISHRDGRVTAIRPDPEDPLSRGFLCPKAQALAEVHEDPDRLRRPVRRRGTDWEEISWDAALDEVADRLRDVQRRHGRDAVAVFHGNPAAHQVGTAIHGWALLPLALRTRNRYSSLSLDSLPGLVAATLVFGHPSRIPVPDVDRTDHLLILGANPYVSGGSAMTAPGFPRRMEAIRARGGRVVVLDPRRTETARAADAHHFVRPGTDAALLLGMLQVILHEGLARPGRLADLTVGIPALADLAQRFTPERVAGPTGVPADVIRRLARDLAAAPRAVAYGRMGTSVQAFGTLSTCLIHALNVVTGNLDRAGGSMFTTPAVDLPALLGRFAPADLGAFRSRVRGLPSLAGELPAAALAEEIDTPGPGQVRALLTSAGNPVLSAPNGGRLDRALAGLEFMASIDLHVNETTRHAHVILPPTPTLAHGHYDLLLHLTAVRNTARYSPPILVPDPGARHDWEIYAGLEARLAPAGARGLAAALLGQAAPERIVDLLLRAGPHGDRFGLRPGGLSLEALRAAPHGVDLGPLEPRLPGLLAHRDRRIHLAPPDVIAEIDRLDRHLAAPRPALVLVGRRDRRSCNTWLHNSARLQRGLHPCRLLVHPDDAAARGLAEGARIRVTSRVGEVEVEITLSDEVMPGVVCLPFGFGHGRPGVHLRIAAANPGVSLNDLTDDAEVDMSSGTAVLNGTPVELARIAPGVDRDA